MGLTSRSLAWRAALTALLCRPGNCLAQWTPIRLHDPARMTASRVLAVTPSQQAGYAILTNPPEIAPTLWTGSPTSLLNLAPNAGDYGMIYGTTGGQQVGTNREQAVLWQGTPASRVDLFQQGWFDSGALGTDGAEQVGYYRTDPTQLRRAALWRGAAASFVNLDPGGGSVAAAVAVGQEGGYINVSGGAYHAALWSGSAASFVDMNPGAQFVESQILGMAPGQQAGWARRLGQNQHAGIWTGTASTYLDLNPAGSGFSHLTATCGSAQAGWANTVQNGITAGIWFGTADSFIALAPFLPGGYGESAATSVAFDGSLYYVGGYALNTQTGTDEAFLWVGIPSPGSGWVLAAAAFLARRRRGAR